MKKPRSRQVRQERGCAEHLATLEDQPRSKLKLSRVKGGCHRAEVPRTGIQADASGVRVSPELGVIPGVERVRAKFEPASTRFADHEALEQREIPIITSRTT